MARSGLDSCYAPRFYGLAGPAPFGGRKVPHSGPEWLSRIVNGRSEARFSGHTPRLPGLPATYGVIGAYCWRWSVDLGLTECKRIART